MTTLVTGATGYLGTVVVERLLASGARGLRCLVRPTHSTLRLQQLQATYGRAAVRLVEGNLLVRRDVRHAVAGVHRVVHLAASMRGAPADMFLNTVVATQRLFEALPGSDVKRLILVSSLAVYGLADHPRACPVREDAPLDPSPERRDVYAHTKIRQEELFHALPATMDIERITLRPGPLYGRNGPEFTSRVGLRLPGLLLHLGGDHPLPLSYVDNCAEAVCRATLDAAFPSGEYNVVDDHVPTASEYLRIFRGQVRRIRYVRLPFSTTMMLSRWLERYHAASKGQIPQVLTPYRSRNIWGGHTYANARLKDAGWSQVVSTHEALTATFAEFRARQQATTAATWRVRVT